MPIKSRLNTLSQLSACLLGMVFASSAAAAEFDQIGTFDFPTSGSAQAQAHFERGVGFLHSFGMTQAQEAFRAAQEADPDFALAYWGETFTYQHPFFGQKSDLPGQALMKLGATTAERMAKAPTEREKGFLKAAEAYALTPGGMPERRTAWMNAMAELYEKFPEDDEVKAFYAASMLAGATAAGPARASINMKAGALALELYKKNDNHPGAAHYVIHAFDDPLHAPIALDAANKYASIAPAVSHARHMPTHIFIQHGLWDQVSVWNHSAFQAGWDLWKPGDRAGDMNHSSDWGQYGDLQRGDLAESAKWIEKAQAVLANNPDDARSKGTVKTMQARHIIESKQWKTQAITDELSDSQLLALGLSAANLGELDLANQVISKLEEKSAASPNNNNLKLIHMEVAAYTLHKEAMASSMVDVNKRQQALEMMQAAIELKEQQLPPNGAPTPLKPVHELTAEMMLEMGMAEEATKVFHVSLERLKNRPLSNLGAARSEAMLNNVDRANQHYRAFLAVWSDDSLYGVKEAKAYLASH